MNMTIALGWWLIPAAMTLGTIILALWPSPPQGDYGFDVGGILQCGLAIIATLSAWLIWSLLT
jgi:hypothetical protein